MFDKLKVEQLVSGRRLSVNVYLHLSNFQAFSMYSFYASGSNSSSKDFGFDSGFDECSQVCVVGLLFVAGVEIVILFHSFIKLKSTNQE